MGDTDKTQKTAQFCKNCAGFVFGNGRGERI
jgi:hypothetical protein